MTTPLPAAPSLEQLRKQAKELVRERETGSEPLRLSEAQREVAREYGFASWPRLKAYVERVSDARPGARARVRRRRRLLRGSRRGAAQRRRERPRERHRRRARPPPGARGRERGRDPRDQRRRTRASCSRASTGSRAGTAFRRHVEGLAESGEPFRRAFQAIEARDRTALASLLDRYPGLVTARGTNGNDLLGLAAPAGGATTRSCASCSQRGADPSSANDRGWTPLHQAGYGNDAELARLLLDAGARTDLYGHGEGGTPLAAALFWGNASVADLLAEREVVPRNLRIAAGLGRLDLIRELVRDDGSLSEAAGAARGFYRPHTGFPHLAALGRSAGDPRRGARVGRQERPRRRARPARRARRRPRRRPLPRHGADLGRGARARRVDPAARRARRRPEPQGHVRRARARAGRDGTAPRRAERQA